MPHKRNPITSERLSGLARILRGNLVAGLEDVALWHERDISHSSVERVILPDSSLLTHYVLEKCRSIIDGLTIDEARMRSNIDGSYGLVFSQPVLLALVASGMSRDVAYRVVQECALRSWETDTSFRSLLERDDRVVLSKTQLDDAFDLQRSLRHSGRVIDALSAVGHAAV